jgi:hypothetical protein
MEMNIFFQIVGYLIGLFSLYLHLNLKIKANEMRIESMSKEIIVLTSKLDKILDNSNKILEQQIKNSVNLSNAMDTIQRHEFKMQLLDK